MKSSQRIDKSLRKPLISREDYPFFLILLVSAIIHLSAAGYLSTIEIKKIKEGAMEVIKGLPPRFGKLILQPMEVTPRRVLTRIIRPERGREILARKIPSAAEERVVPAAPEKKGVGYSGLLGVIMAKAGPREISTAAVFRDIDKVMKEVKREEPRDRVKDVLSGLHIKEMGKTEGVSIGISKPAEPQPMDTGEIVKEKKEVLLEEVDKKRAVSGPGAVKKYEAEVYAAILSYTGGLKFLYNNALRKDPSLKGAITVKMVISPTGKASEVIIVSSTLNAPELEKAIADRIYMWRFPAFKWGESFTTTYTFDFSVG